MLGKQQLKVLETIYKADPEGKYWWGASIGGRKIPDSIVSALYKANYLEGGPFYNGVPINIKLTTKGKLYVENISLRASVIKIAHEVPETRKYLLPILSRY